MPAIFGLIANDTPRETLHATHARMAAAAKSCKNHPGASWEAPEAPLVLGCESIEFLDLTPDGKQPYVCAGKKLVCVLDGYIANGAALRRELEETGPEARPGTLQGHSDAELLCEATARWGLNRLLQKLEGAFAFALWDGNTATLHLVRDRLGTRQLFTASAGGMVAFANTPAALLAIPGVDGSLDTAALKDCLKNGYIAAPQTAYAGIRALPPGHRLMIETKGNEAQKPEKWWCPAATLEEINLRHEPENATSQLKLDRLRLTLAAEAARLDTAFTVYDDGSADARLLQTGFARASDKTFKALHASAPDGINVQKAFDALCAAPAPVTIPAAIFWWHALSGVADASTVIMLATEGANASNETTPGTPQKPPRIPAPLRRLAAAVAPAYCAHWAEDAHKTFSRQHTLWPEVTAHDTTARITTPRMDISARLQAAYLEMCGPFMEWAMPNLATVATKLGLEVRTPWADARTFAFYLPRLATEQHDTAGWLRGPLRIRMQNALDKKTAALIGLDDTSKIEKCWNDFLAGKNTDARRLWVYLALAGWAAHHHAANKNRATPAAGA